MILDGNEDDTMNLLLDRDNNKWDVTKVHNLFNPVVAIEILKIPFSPTPTKTSGYGRKKDLDVLVSKLPITSSITRKQ